MRLGIKAKQVAGVTSIVGLAVVVLSLIHLSSLAHISLEESRARGELLANAIYHRAREVVGERGNPYEALRKDAGLRSILESSIYSKNVTYAAILDASGVAVAHTDPGREGQRVAARGDLTELLAQSSLQQLRMLYSDEGRTLEVEQPLLLGTARFGSIRIGVSTLLIRRELDAALRPPLVTALIALLVATVVAMLLAQLLLRPIHIIRSGLTRLGKGEFGVKLDLPQQDEFGELGMFFNAVSAQLSADRSQLAGQKAKLETVVEHLEDEVAIFNPEGELLFANPAMRTALPEEPFGRPVDDVLPYGHPYRSIVQETLLNRESRGPVAAILGAPEGKGETPGVRNERLMMTHAIEDLHGRLVGVMLVARNLGYLGQVQSTINYSRKLVALGRLSAGVAHEVKNPLNAMMIHLELLRNKLTSAMRPQIAGAAGAGLAFAAGSGRTAVAAAPAEGVAELPGVLEHVGIIAEEIRRLDQVVQGFLKFTRPEEIRLQPVDLASLIDEIVQVVRPEAEKSSVNIEVQNPKELPDIHGDPGMLRQAFLNLAINACQAMPHGGTLRIVCSPARGRRVEISFEDEGIGIKPEHLERIFDLYFTTKEQGSGIGLSMVYRIVQMHDGEVEVESTPGRGTKFRLLLPQA